MSYFKTLADLLKRERDDDRAMYAKLTETTSVSERRANGLAWYPIAIRGTEMSRGDYLSVELERTTHQDLPHQFRFGMPAVLFSNHDPKHDRIEGTITFSGGNRAKLTLKTDELPEWSRNGKLGLDALFDDNSYDEMFAAMKAAAELIGKPEGKLVRILTGEGEPEFDQYIQTAVQSGLNTSQNEALHRILSAKDVAIVHGPPGTGKTTTLVAAIQELVRKRHGKILVVAPSNAAVDLLSERLSDTGLRVVRVGNPARVSEKLLSLTLDEQMTGHAQHKEVRRLKKQASEFKNMAHKYKRHFGKSERDQRKALFDEAHRIMRDVGAIEQYAIEDILAKADVITATLVGSNHHTVRHLRYDTVVIDEAGQALEPACWIPVLKGDSVVLAGDHCQLPPTIKSEEAARLGLNTTLLEKNVALHPEAVTLLNEQYRMHQEIMRYSSKVFYSDRLKAHPAVAGHLLTEGEQALTFIDTAGCGFDEKLEGTSSTNPEEADFLLKHLNNLIENLPRDVVAKRPSIAVISPYKQQIEVLRQKLVHFPLLVALGDQLSVNTIDSFQGQERDVVYISMTRSNPDGAIGFLSDIRRMNVAMTRARKKLVIVGDSGTLSQLDFYANFIAYAESVDGYKSAWEFMTD